MSRFLVCALSAALVVGCAGHETSVPNDGEPQLTSGIDLQWIDKSVRPQDDAYQYLNGNWLKSFAIPADKAVYGSFTAIDDSIQDELRGIIESLPQNGGDEDTQKVVDMYASFMDEERLETLGLKPLQAEFAAIDAMKDVAAIPAMMAHLTKIGAGGPFALAVGVDAKNSSQYAVTVFQSGLGMPDRDYYLEDGAKLKATRLQYASHIEKLLSLAGDQQAGKNAAAILALETSIAKVQWTRVENRDPIKTYNKKSFAELVQVMPGYDWRSFLRGTGVEGRTDALIVSQPSYFAGLSKLFAATPLPVWKTYFKWRVLSASAPYLSKAFVDERFAFSGTVLRDVPQNQPRWKRGINLIDASLGEALGKRYVEKYFPPENKARMQSLVRNVLEAYRRDIETLDWMSPETKLGAQEKLAKVSPKIGYPDRWRDYSALRIARDDLRGNVVRAAEFEYWRNVDKLGKPVDRGEWNMTPQTVNAYYNPTKNEIVFPAAILRPPFFDAKADDAANYGGIGGVIGHELSHGFDDRGSQYDADGNLRDWFTKEDHDKFAAKTKALVAQYDAYEPVPGYHVNGALTLGENIGDNSGLAIAYRAYHLSLGLHTPAVIDGFTGDQRLYLGWVQVWRGKAREAEKIQRIKTDPHSPADVRGLAPLRNQPGFYKAFDLKPGDKMYLAPEQRVIIW
jgi:putative endopeptidase